MQSIWWQNTSVSLQVGRAFNSLVQMKPFLSLLKEEGGSTKQNLKKALGFPRLQKSYINTDTLEGPGQQTSLHFCCDISLCQSRRPNTKDMQSHEHEKEALKCVLVAGMHKSGFRCSRGIRGNRPPGHMQCHGHRGLVHRRVVLARITQDTATLLCSFPLPSKT